MATVAIFIALGGVSYAATNLGKNSVGTKQIKKNAVTTAKLKKNAVTTAKIKKKAVKTSKVAGGAVTTGKLGNEAVTQAKVDPGLLSTIDEDAKLKVYNADGSVLGDFMGALPSGIVIFQVMIDDGLYIYYPSGQLIPFGSDSPVFKNNTCTGTAYIESDEDEANFILSKLAGGPTRVTFRTAMDFDLGPISAWKYTTNVETVVGVNLWEFDSNTGSCDPTTSSPFTGALTALEPVTPPPDGIGPLTVR